MAKSTKIGMFLLNNLIWVILIFFVIINIFITPHFFTYRNIINILYHSSILGILILAQGICLISGNFDLSIESTLAFAPAIAVLVVTKWLPGLDFSFAILITLIVGFLVGAFNGYCISMIGINAFLQTLSMLIIIRGLTLWLVPFTIYDLPKVYTFLGSERIIGNIPISVLTMLLLFGIANFVIKKMSFGRYIMATGGNPMASFISGIDTKKTLFFTFVLSGVLASIAGLLAVGRQAAITSAMGEDMVLLSFAGAVLGGVSLKGGIGTPLGMLGGALFIGAVDNSLTLLGLNVFIVYAVKGVLILLAVILDNFKIKAKNALYSREEIRKFRLER